MNGSYIKTLDLLEADKPQEAHTEFRRGFMLTAMKVYSESPQTYPMRFEGIDDWCAWVRHLFVDSRNIARELRLEQADQAMERLVQMRAHFYQLHKESERLNTADRLFEARRELATDQPSTADLKASLDALAAAPASQSAAARKADWNQAVTDWRGTIQPALEDEALSAEEIEALRQATEKIYAEFGRDLE